MMLIRNFIIAFTTLLFSQAAFAAFPQDFSDVTWIGPNIGGWPVTSTLRASVNGGTITVDHTKKNSWPISTKFASWQRVNASCWGFVKKDGRWYAGTWEYLRKGVSTRKTSTYGGAGHFRPPIGTFRPQNGEIYGFMIAGVSRDTLSGNNVRERTNVVLWRWGVGGVPIIIEPEPEPVPDTPVVTPAIDLLMQP